MVRPWPQDHAVPGSGPLQFPVRPAWLLLVMAGGTIGTAVRAWLEGLHPPAGGEWPWTTFWINVSGAGVLGVLLAALAHAGPDRGWVRAVRLGLGTGVLGGFTTYSTFTVETVELLRGGAWPVAAGYAVLSVAAGVAAAYAGARLARRVARRLGRGGRGGPA